MEFDEQPVKEGKEYSFPSFFIYKFYYFSKQDYLKLSFFDYNLLLLLYF